MSVETSDTENGIATGPDARDLRAEYEQFAVTVCENGVVNVRNDSYGREAGAHIYSVRVRAGCTLSCTCPSDEYQPGPCKHRRHLESHQPLALSVASGKSEGM